MSHPCKKEETGVCCGGCTKYKESEEKTIPNVDNIVQQDKQAEPQQQGYKYQYTMQG